MIAKMKITPLCLLIILLPSYSLAFVSKSHAGYSSRLPPSSPLPMLATPASSTTGSRSTQVFLAGPPLESTSTLVSLGDVASSLQVFYTAALVAGVGYSQRMAGRQDFKKEMATKIADGSITPEEIVDEITLMAEEINNDISESKSLAEAAQEEVQNLLEEMQSMQEQLSQIPDALNIQKAALAVEKKEPVVKAAVQEKVLVTAGGNKERVVERVTAGGHNEESSSSIPIGVVDGFGVYDDVFEIEETEEEEMEWSVPVVNHDEEVLTKSATTADESKESKEKKDTAGDSTESIRKQAEDFRARIKQMEARISKDTATATPPAPAVEDSIRADPAASQAEEVVQLNIKPSPPASEPSTKALRSSPDTATVTEQTAKSNTKPSPPAPKPPVKSNTKPSPPASEPPVKVLKTVEIETVKPKKTVPDGPIRSSPLARVLCSDLGVELADCYPGTGLNGRVIAEDVRNYAKNRGN